MPRQSANSCLDGYGACLATGTISLAQDSVPFTTIGILHSSGRAFLENPSITSKRATTTASQHTTRTGPQSHVRTAVQSHVGTASQRDISSSTGPKSQHRTRTGPQSHVGTTSQSSISSSTGPKKPLKIALGVSIPIGLTLLCGIIITFWLWQRHLRLRRGELEKRQPDESRQVGLDYGSLGHAPRELDGQHEDIPELPSSLRPQELGSQDIPELPSLLRPQELGSQCPIVRD